MKNAKKFSAFAAVAAALVCACAAQAGGVELVDWSSVSGTYTVPADTTNDVTSIEDFERVSNLSSVTFGNANSALRFTVPYYPHNLQFRNPGTVIMSERVLITATNKSETVINSVRNTLANKGFLKGVFEKGIDSDDGSTKRKLGVSGEADYYGTVAISFLGPVSNVNVTLNTRIDLGDDAYLDSDGNALAYDSRVGMIRQRGGTFLRSSYYLGGKTAAARAAYVMEGGVSTNLPTWALKQPYVYGRYFHFRQTGGYFIDGVYQTPDDHRGWFRPDSQNAEANKVIPSDFIFGGKAVALNRFDGYVGPYNLAVMGDADVMAKWIAGNGEVSAKYHHILAANGGVMTRSIYEVLSNRVFHAFNGGTVRRYEYPGARAFGYAGATGNPVQVRVYENGGCIDNGGQTSAFYLPNLKAPEGNVLMSVALSEELAGKIWTTPPAVEITDSTHSGTNAWAIADYDFDSGKVTNITIVCRGEKYSGEEGAVTANLRYKDGDALLTTPLVCTVGPCASGDMTFCGTGTGPVNSGASTNTYEGLTVIDMDMNGDYDHPASTKSADQHSFIVSANAYTPFFASTGIVVRSGGFGRDYVNGRPYVTNYFPRLQRLELYGGHIASFVFEVKDTVVGGETWITRHSLDQWNANYAGHLYIPANGTLWIDAASAATNNIPTLKYGRFVARAGAKLKIRNPEALKDFGTKRPVLDLSGVENLSGTENLELPTEHDELGRLFWNEEKTILYWRKHSDGMMLIFR